MNWVLKGRNIFTADCRIVAQVHYPVVPGEVHAMTSEVMGEMAKNALVLTAAPDLLAALKAMFADACDCGPDVHCRSCELGLRAIAKAEGK